MVNFTALKPLLYIGIVKSNSGRFLLLSYIWRIRLARGPSGNFKISFR